MILPVATLVLAVPFFVRASAADMDPALRAAHEMFYNGRYADAAAATAALCTPNVAALPACELRTSALHFQLRRALGDLPQGQQTFARCAECADLLSTFVAETKRGQETARTGLKAKPGDEDTLFFLGKLDLNYVWLQLGTVGRKTGWSEYWEARKSLDAVLKSNPDHVRARVARAWIDYIVDTKLPRGTRWMLGGGNKRKALTAMQEAASSQGEYYSQAEAVFGLWDMQVRERRMAEAVVTARSLARDFPDNQELAKFLAAHDSRPNFTSAAVR